MNHFVPDFDTDDDYAIPGASSSSYSPSLNLPRKSAMVDEDIMELLWHNGQVVLQSQSTHQQIPHGKKSSSPPDLAGGGAAAPDTRPLPPQQQQPPDQNLFMQEDEMVSWLHYPLREDDFCSDLLYSASASASQPQIQSISRVSSVVQAAAEAAAAPPERSANQVSAARPSIPPERTENERRTVRNFANFSRFLGKVESGRPSSAATATAVVRESAAGSDVMRRKDGGDARLTINGGASSAASGGDAVAAHEKSGMSYSKGKAVRAVSPPETERTEIAGDRKRKGREAVDETECRSEETKQARGSTSTKRSRATEVHNLSERRRRDRINERMRILQELIPRCNKSDKASLLDEAIEYTKSLQLQVQMMMAMGYGMTPMMYPGMQQQYLQQVAMGMGMGMNRPFVPFPNMLATTPSLPTMAHTGGPAFLTPPFPVPNIHAVDPSRCQGQVQRQQADPASNSLHAQHLNQPLQQQQQQPLQGFLDPYQQFVGLQPMQASILQQNRATSSKPSSSSSKEPADQENLPAG